jgi:hypothetical protein
MKRVFLLLFLLCAVPAGAADRYFDPVGGSDSGAGTIGDPWQTVDKLNDLFQGLNGLSINCGDNVYLKRGTTFTANDTSDRILINNKACTTGSRIKIDAYDSGADPILNHEAITNTWAVRVQRSAFIEIRNLDVRGGIIAVAYEGVTDGVFSDGAIRNAEQQCFHSFRASKTTAGTNSARITIENNTITGCGASGVSNGEGIYIGVDQLQIGSGGFDTSGPYTIRGNDISNVTHEGMEIKQGITSPLIERNYIHDSTTTDANNAGAISIQGAVTGAIVRFNRVEDIAGPGGQGIRARGATVVNNNTIDTVAAEGIAVTDPVGNDPTISIYNNTVYDAALTGILISGNPNATMKNNIGWSNLTGTNTSTAYFNDAADPLFVNAGTGDFNLQATSPAINAGTSCTYAGNGAACDRGAHETIVFSAGEVGNVDAVTTVLTFTNNAFPPLLPASACTGFTREEETSPGVWAALAVSACARNPLSTNQIALTHAAATDGRAQRFSYVTASGNITDSALIGNSANQRLNAITNQTITENLAAPPVVWVVTQTNFRFYNLHLDASGLLVPLGAVNTNRSVVPGARFIVVNQLDATDDDAPTFAASLRYSLNGGAYTPITDAFTADNIRAYGLSNLSSTVPSDSTALTACLAGALGIVEGSIRRTANAVPNVTLAEDTCVALGVMVEIDRDAAVGDEFEFRSYNQDGTALVYDVTGKITIKAHQAGL